MPSETETRQITYIETSRSAELLVELDSNGEVVRVQLEPEVNATWSSETLSERLLHLHRLALMRARHAQRLRMNELGADMAPSDVYPGEAAWKANVKPGDVVEQIGDKPVQRFDDLFRTVSLGDNDGSVTIVVRRPGEDGTDKRLKITLKPERIRDIFMIGVGNCYTPALSDRLPVIPGSPAALARPASSTDSAPVDTPRKNRSEMTFSSWWNRADRNPGATLIPMTPPRSASARIISSVRFLRLGQRERQLL